MGVVWNCYTLSLSRCCYQVEVDRERIVQGKALCLVVASTSLAIVPVCVSVSVECWQVLEDKSRCLKEGLSSGVAFVILAVESSWTGAVQRRGMKEELFAGTTTSGRQLQLYPGIHTYMHMGRYLFIVYKIHPTTSELHECPKESIWLKV